jgi:catechol 2,3-dioxygenase-like lactoylglutathione lyase family enzyme
VIDAARPAPLASTAPSGHDRPMTDIARTFTIGIDHIVLTVRAIEDTCAFYADALGAEAVTFGDGRRAIQIGRQKINLHEAGHEFEPKARQPTPGSGDLCFVTDEPLEDVIARLERGGIPIEEGPVARTGAVGPLRSVYVRDPDGNLVEIANQRA